MSKSKSNIRSEGGEFVEYHIKFEDLLPIVFTSQDKSERYDPTKIQKSLMMETKISELKSREIAIILTRKLIASPPSYLSSPEIREMVCMILIEQGLEKERLQYTRIGFPFADIDNIMKSKLGENEKKEKIFEHIKKEYLGVKNLVKRLGK